MKKYYLLLLFVLQEYLAVLAEIKSLGPMTGAGFFDITKGTLTAMLGTTLTYAIILMQWKP